jgi:hypothetical protein
MFPRRCEMWLEGKGRCTKPVAVERHGTEFCYGCDKTRALWYSRQGSTVRITQGALAGTIGRLNGVGYVRGQITFRTGSSPHLHPDSWIGEGNVLDYQQVWVSYSDLKLVDKDGGSHPQVEHMRCCHSCYCPFGCPEHTHCRP